MATETRTGNGFGILSGWFSFEKTYILFGGTGERGQCIAKVTLCTEHRNFMYFCSKIARMHTKYRKWTPFGAICFLKAFKTMRKNDEMCENPRKSPKILDGYPTKINEKSRFEHVQVTLCKKAWFSRPERFWSPSGNALHRAPKFRGFSFENC